MMRISDVALDLADTSTVVLEQIKTDWAESPFTNIELVDASDEQVCPTSTKPVFYRTWGGTKDGCLMNASSRDEENEYAYIISQEQLD